MDIGLKLTDMKRSAMVVLLAPPTFADSFHGWSTKPLNLILKHTFAVARLGPFRRFQQTIRPVRVGHMTINYKKEEAEQ